MFIEIHDFLGYILGYNSSSMSLYPNFLRKGLSIMALTDTQIKKLKPTLQCKPNRPDKYTDGKGLQLRVRHTGNKVWVVVYRYQNKSHDLTIGQYPQMGLSEARQRHLEIKAMLSDGLDPKQERDKQKVIDSGLLSFGNIALKWFDELHKPNVTPKTFNRDFSQYEHDIKPFIAHKDIDKITPIELLEIAKRIENRGSLSMGKRAIQKIGQIYTYAIQHGLTTHNPTYKLTEALASPKEKHYARIKFNQLPKLLADIENANSQPIVKYAVEFLCLTFVRTSELRFMQWHEIDGSLWRIPAERMKMKRPHIVPLSKQALAVLAKVKALGLSNTYVFYNTSTQKPLSENFCTQLLERLGYKGVMTGHGFRGLASTTLHERQFEHKAIELQLAHDSDNKVSKAYNGAELLPYRIDMMNEWGQMVENAKQGKIDNVIYFDKQRKAVNE